MKFMLSHYISKPNIIKTPLKECEMVLSLTFAFAGGGPGNCFYFGFLGNALFSRIHFFGMRSLFWGDFWASIFFNGISNSPTSSSLWPSSCLSLSLSSLNSSLSAMFSKSCSYAMNHYWNLRNFQRWCVRCMIWSLIKHKNTLLLQFLKISCMSYSKLWWSLVQTRRNNIFRPDIVAQIWCEWVRRSWASWWWGNIFWWNEGRSDFGLGSGSKWLSVWFWS